MQKLFTCVFLALACLAPFPINAEEDALTNTDIPSLPSTLSPGAVILLPDGGQSVILESLANGDLLTDLGIAISPQGLIRDGEFKGQTVKLDPAFTPSRTAVAPEAEKPIPETAPKNPEQDKQENPGLALPSTPVQPAQELPDRNKAVAPPDQKQEKSLTLAELLPLTSIEGQKKASPKKLEEEKKPAQPEKKAETKKVETKKESQPEKKAEPKKIEKPEAKAAPVKKRSGEALRIPPEAVKKGDLSFLEGCWQGTRPEYFSKRTIKECFCFNANGRSGKRRIYDGAQRMCIGATKATLSSSGVLSVTSSGAVCNDGERWGGAEMVCRNSGPRTPCSWVFTDANNGRQAYEIPFVRVESCGR